MNNDNNNLRYITLEQIDEIDARVTRLVDMITFYKSLALEIFIVAFIQLMVIIYLLFRSM